MKLIKLTTQNFKKLGDSSFDFTEGLNVIVGENARGKSTLLQAIEAALYGTTVVPGKKENVPTWGQKTFKLELSFSIDAHDYVLTRTHSTAKLMAAGVDGEAEIVANGNTPVTAYIEQLLGLTAKDYNLFLQSKQGETAGILTFGGAALSRKVEEFAGIDVIDKVQAASNDRARALLATAAALSVSPEELKNLMETMKELTARLPSAKEAAANLQAAMIQLGKLNVKNPSPTSEELSRKRRAVDKQLRESAAAESTVASLSSQLEVVEAEEVATPADIGERDEELKLNQARIKEIAAEKSDIEQRVRTHATQAIKVSELQVKAKAAAQAVDELTEETDLETLQSELQGSALQVAAAHTLVVELTLQIKQLTQLSEDADCPTCGTRLGDHDPEKLKAEIAELKDKLSVATNAEITAGVVRNNTSRLIDQIQKAMDTAQRIESEHAAAAKALQELTPAAPLEPVLEALEDEHVQLAMKAEGLRLVIAIHEQELATFSRHQAKLDTLRKQLTAAEKELSELGKPEAAPTDAEIDAAAQVEADNRKLEAEHQAKQRTLQKEIDDAESVVKEAERDVASAEKELTALQVKQEEFAQAEADADKCKRLSRFLGDRRASYLKEVWDVVLSAASKQVKLSSGNLIEGISYSDGDFLYVEDGIEAPVSSASGAQKAHIGVAVRIGLARALYGSDNLLIFDEPTESMSEHHAAGLAGSLAGTAKQVFLITHREQDQGLAQTIIEL